MNFAEHPFWCLLAAACIVWYSTVTVYVAVRGAIDIRRMLARLDRVHAERSRES